MVRRQFHSTDPTSSTPHSSNIGFSETYRFPTIGEQHDILFSIGDRNTNKMIPLIQVNSDDTHLSRTGKMRQRRLFNNASRCRHKHEVIIIKLSDRKDSCDLFALGKLNHIHNWLTPASSPPLGNFINFQPIHLPLVGETQDVIVGMSDKEVIHKIILFCLSRLFTSTTSALRSIIA